MDYFKSKITLYQVDVAQGKQQIYFVDIMNV
ncbi:hypothetical protein BN1044_01255 [Hafnia alvei]|uniref:Uncharacterized protein n=1 Tax=Hafnia alvei TaxID=569 RepID=A0A1C6YY14_HAFAL|nr:hypothetical protein BN1044_01255 [Hafnia alvei]